MAEARWAAVLSMGLSRLLTLLRAAVVSLKMQLCPYKAMLCPRLAVTQPSCPLFRQPWGFNVLRGWV